MAAVRRKKSVPEISSLFLDICHQEGRKKPFAEKKESKSIPPHLIELMDECKRDQIDFNQVLAYRDPEKNKGCSGLELAALSLNPTSFNYVVPKEFKVPKGDDSYLNLNFIYYLTVYSPKNAKHVAQRLQNHPGLRDPFNLCLANAFFNPIVVNEVSRELAKLLFSNPEPSADMINSHIKILSRAGLIDNFNSIEHSDLQKIHKSLIQLSGVQPRTYINEENVKSMILNWMIGLFEPDRSREEGNFLSPSILIRTLGMPLFIPILNLKVPGLDISLLSQLITKESYLLYRPLFDFEPIEIAEVVAAAKNSFGEALDRNSKFLRLDHLTDEDVQAGVKAGVIKMQELKEEKKYENLVDRLNPTQFEQIRAHAKSQIRDFYKQCRWLAKPEKYFKSNPHEFVALVAKNIGNDWNEVTHHDLWIDLLNRVVIEAKKNKNIDPLLIDQLHALCGMVHFSKFQLTISNPSELKESLPPPNQENFILAIQHWWAIQSAEGLPDDLNELIALNIRGINDDLLKILSHSALPPSIQKQEIAPFPFDPVFRDNKWAKHMRSIAEAPRAPVTSQTESLFTVGLFGFNDQKYQTQTKNLPVDYLKNVTKTLRKQATQQLLHLSELQLPEQHYVLLVNSLRNLEKLCELTLTKLNYRNVDYPSISKYFFNQLQIIQDEMGTEITKLNKLRTGLDEKKYESQFDSLDKTLDVLKTIYGLISDYVEKLPAMERHHEQALRKEGLIVINQGAKELEKHAKDLLAQFHDFSTTTLKMGPREAGYIINMDKRKEFLYKIEREVINAMSGSMDIFRDKKDFNSILRLTVAVEESLEKIEQYRQEYEIQFIGKTVRPGPASARSLDEEEAKYDDFPFLKALNNFKSSLSHLSNSLSQTLSIREVVQSAFPILNEQFSNLRFLAAMVKGDTKDSPEIKTLGSFVPVVAMFTQDEEKALKPFIGNILDLLDKVKHSLAKLKELLVKKDSSNESIVATMLEVKGAAWEIQEYLIGNPYKGESNPGSPFLDGLRKLHSTISELEIPIYHHPESVSFSVIFHSTSDAAGPVNHRHRFH